MSTSTIQTQNKKATRDAYGQTLLELSKIHDDIVVLDADLSGSTKTNLFAKEFPNRFFNVGVAEQNLVGMAAGFALAGLVPFASSFAMFLSGRAWEIIRNSIAYPNLNVKLVSTHAGLTVGEDGASHQCLEDIATMRVIPNMNVFVPSDYNETIEVIKRVYEIKGPCYVRCGRSAVKVLDHKYNNENESKYTFIDENESKYTFIDENESKCTFKEGKGEIRSIGKDVLIIACGIMVEIAELANEKLLSEGISATIVNMASIKPIDEKLIIDEAKKVGAVVTAEEHNIIGGLGGAVSEVLGENFPVPIIRVGVKDTFGQSGDANALLEYYGLTSLGLYNAVKKVIKLKKS